LHLLSSKNKTGPFGRLRYSLTSGHKRPNSTGKSSHPLILSQFQFCTILLPNCWPSKHFFKCPPWAHRRSKCYENQKHAFSCLIPFSTQSDNSLHLPDAIL